jgi:8-oxo-dGTP pyrophosphatase MutT (NUDIX family)
MDPVGRPRPAATVVVLRRGEPGLEVYLQRRPRTMGFAAGLWVFPGGRVDPYDADPAMAASWAGPSPSAWAERIGVPVEEARGLVVAACRETFEEAGVLLSDRPPGGAELQEARRRLLAGERDFARILAGMGVRLDTDQLRYWAWWLTPEGEPRRYDTRFFVAALPSDAAVTAHGLAEVERERWLPPAVAAADESMPMLPPTRFTLRDLSDFATVEEVLAAGLDRPVEQVLPRLEGNVLVMPWNERYPVPVLPAKAARSAPPPKQDGVA